MASHPRKGATLDLGVRWLVPRSEALTPIALDTTTWETLAVAFKKVRRAERATTQEAVREARASAPLPLALWLDGAALLAEEAADDIAQLALRGDEAWTASAQWVAAALPALVSEPSPRTRAAALTILEQLDEGLVNRFAAHAKAVVNLVGAEAAGPVIELIGIAHRSTVVEPARAKLIAEALATLDLPLVRAFFERSVESRLVGPVAAAYLVAGPVKDAEPTPRAVTVHEAATAERQLRSKRAKVTAKKATAQRRRAAAVGEAREATGSELPWVLREAPWRNPQATPPLPELPLPPRAPFAETLHLRESDREGIDATTAVDGDDPVGLLVQRGLAALPAVLAMPRPLAVRGLRLVASPRVASWMLEELAGPRRALAKTYFSDHPAAVAAALIPRVLGPGGEKRALLDAVNLLADVGHTDALRAEAASYGPDAVHAFEHVLSAGRLVDCPRDAASSPSWVTLAKLPPVLLANGARLPADALERLVQMLALAETERPYPGIADVRAVFDGAAIDALLIRFVELWTKAKRWEERWVLRAAASLGGADVMRALVKLAKEWARERTMHDHGRGIVEALGAGGLTAAAVLVDLARTGGQVLAETAEASLRVIARREQLSTDDLADVSVPSLGLDETGRATLDFGSRTFEVSLGDDLAPRIVDGEGHAVTSVRAHKSDDRAKAQLGLERLRSLKKSLGEVARRSAIRFEQAMIVGRGWRAELFHPAIVGHPVLGRIARRLVWACCEPRSDAKVLLRIAEDGTFADVEDEVFEIDPRHRLRLVHPLELDDVATRAWGDVLGDYAIVQPFPQIGRRVFAPTAAEATAGAFTRFQGLPALQMALQGRLVARGWERLTDGRMTYAYIKRLKTVTAQYTLASPLGFGDAFVNETTVGAVTFGTPLGQVPPILFSEVVYDLHVFAE